MHIPYIPLSLSIFPFSSQPSSSILFLFPAYLFPTYQLPSLPPPYLSAFTTLLFCSAVTLPPFLYFLFVFSFHFPLPFLSTFSFHFFFPLFLCLPVFLAFPFCFPSQYFPSLSLGSFPLQLPQRQIEGYPLTFV